MHKLRIGALAAGIVLAASVPCHADLIGSSVTGSLTFKYNPVNYYDPGNLYVPGSGQYLNQAGPSVTISGSATEFGFADTYDTITANFTGNSLIITDTGLSGAGWTQTFIDTAFEGATFVKTTDDFASGGLQYLLTGDVLTVTWTGISGDPPGWSGGFTYNSGTVPEPASWLMLLFTSAVILAAFRLKRASA